MNQVEASRLLTLAWFLRTEVPDHKFNLLSFINSDTLAECTHECIEDMECETTACALGWCPTVFDEWCWWDGVGHLLPMLSETIHDVLRVPPSGCASQFFGLSFAEVEMLFFSGCRTPAEEAKCIEQVCEKHGWVYGDDCDSRPAKDVTRPSRRGMQRNAVSVG